MNITEIDNAIDTILKEHESKRICCLKLQDALRSFYHPAFLKTSYYVPVDSIPKPQVSGPGFEDFLQIAVDGITYKDTYFIKTEYQSNIILHLHELVHVAQWRKLGSIAFLSRYIQEIQSCGYDGSSLENMAREAQGLFESSSEVVDLEQWVYAKLIDET